MTSSVLHTDPPPSTHLFHFGISTSLTSSSSSFSFFLRLLFFFLPSSSSYFFSLILFILCFPDVFSFFFLCPLFLPLLSPTPPGFLRYFYFLRAPLPCSLFPSEIHFHLPLQLHGKFCFSMSYSSHFSFFTSSSL